MLQVPSGVFEQMLFCLARMDESCKVGKRSEAPLEPDLSTSRMHEFWGTPVALLATVAKFGSCPGTISRLCRPWRQQTAQCQTPDRTIGPDAMSAWHGPEHSSRVAWRGPQ